MPGGVHSSQTAVFSSCCSPDRDSSLARSCSLGGLEDGQDDAKQIHKRLERETCCREEEEEVTDGRFKGVAGRRADVKGRLHGDNGHQEPADRLPGDFDDLVRGRGLFHISETVTNTLKDVKNCESCGGIVAQKLSNISEQIEALTFLLVGDMHTLATVPINNSNNNKTNYCTTGPSNSNNINNTCNNINPLSPTNSTGSENESEYSDSLDSVQHTVHSVHNYSAHEDRLQPPVYNAHDSTLEESVLGAENGVHSAAVHDVQGVHGSADTSEVDLVDPTSPDFLILNPFSGAQATFSRIYSAPSFVETTNNNNNNHNNYNIDNNINNHFNFDVAPSFNPGVGITRISLVRDTGDKIVQLTRQDDELPTSTLYSRLPGNQSSQAVTSSCDTCDTWRDNELPANTRVESTQTDDDVNAEDGSVVEENVAFADGLSLLLDEQRKLVHRLKEKLAEREAKVATLETEISEKEARVATLENRINELQLNIANSQQTTQDQSLEIRLLGRQIDQLQRDSDNSKRVGEVEGRRFIIRDLQGQVQNLQEKNIKKNSLIRKMAEVLSSKPDTRAVVQTIRESTVKPSDRRIDFDIDSVCSFIQRRRPNERSENTR